MTAPMHVCILTTAHPTDDVRVNSRIAGAFLAAGFRVSWVGPSNAYFRAAGELDERIDYHLFVPNATKWKRLTAARRARRSAKGLGAVDWWYSPDPDAAGLATKLARKYGGRVLFDIHEVFHGALLDRWFPVQPTALVREVVRKRIARNCRRSDLVIGVSAAVLEPYVSDGVDALVVRNCAPRWFADGAAEPRGANGPMRVMHGKALPTNGAALVADAVEALPASAAGRLAVYMNHPGGGPSTFSDGLLQRFARGPSNDTITINPGVPHEAMPALLRSCDVGMVAYGRDLGIDSLPNRLFEYMASGLAILAPSYAVEIAAIVEAEGVGRLVDFERPEEVAASLVWMLEHPEEVQAMGRRAREAFLRTYNWGSESERLIIAMGSASGR